MIYIQITANSYRRRENTALLSYDAVNSRTDFLQLLGDETIDARTDKRKGQERNMGGMRERDQLQKKENDKGNVFPRYL
jgi:hypothetical protein